eukprot:403364444
MDHKFERIISDDAEFRGRAFDQDAGLSVIKVKRSRLVGEFTPQDQFEIDTITQRADYILAFLNYIPLNYRQLEMIEAERRIQGNLIQTQGVHVQNEEVKEETKREEVRVVDAAGIITRQQRERYRKVIHILIVIAIIIAYIWTHDLNDIVKGITRIALTSSTIFFIKMYLGMRDIY